MKEDIYKITRKDGREYTVRKDRSRYFYPNEWHTFRDKLREKKKPLFDFLINTGCRINEALHIRPIDFDFSRDNVRIWKVKVKAAKGEKTGKPRTISLSTKFSRQMRRISRKKDNDERLFVGSPTSAWQMMRRNLIASGIKDYYNFSLHNIRKSHGMWLKSLNVQPTEICLRLGHDMNTYLKHYGSSDIFTERDRDKIRDILGDLPRRMRRE